MAMDLRSNPYQGINAHLHSELQTIHTKIEGSQPDSWSSFHSDHITYITGHLNQYLPRGYVARTEASIQVRVESPEILSFQTIRSPQPDISVWRTHLPEGAVTTTVQVKEPTVVIARVEQTFAVPTEKPMRAAIIYNHRDEPVTRIELLSPANKPPSGSYRKQYLELREQTIKSGLALVELDFLHETQSPILSLPDYPTEPDSYPYRITISNPRQSTEIGQILVYGFHVDEPIPGVGIPLIEDIIMPFDFMPAYNETFMRGLWGERLDYSKPPVRFETYSKEDQERILKRMEAIQAMMVE